MAGTMPKGDVGQLLKRHLQRGETAVDVGAAEGVMTAVMRKAVGPEGWVIAIEPREGKTIHCADEQFTVAIGSEASAILKVTDPAGMSSLHPRAIAYGTHQVGKLAVQMKRLDDLVADAHLVKVDTQGSEVDVLLTAPRLLTTCPRWLVEVWPHGLWSAGHSVGELWDLLHGAGLTIRDADGGEVTRERAGVWLLSMSQHEKYTNWMATR